VLLPLSKSGSKPGKKMQVRPHFSTSVTCAGSCCSLPAALTSIFGPVIARDWSKKNQHCGAWLATRWRGLPSARAELRDRSSPLARSVPTPAARHCPIASRPMSGPRTWQRRGGSCCRGSALLAHFSGLSCRLAPPPVGRRLIWLLPLGRRDG
jgi:hypothetical protein